MNIHPDVQAAADYVSSMTDIPASLVLAQWAYEQPDGISNPAKFNYNIAGLTKSGTPGEWREYSSALEFAQDYVFSFILKGFPKAIGATDADSLAAGLKKGTYGSYYGTATEESYAAGIKSRYKQLFGDDGDDLESPVLESESDLTQEERAAQVKAFLAANGSTGTISAYTQTPLEKAQAKIRALQNYVKYGKQANESPAETTEREEKESESGWKSFISEKLKAVRFIVSGLALLAIGAWLLFKVDSPTSITKEVLASE